MLISKKYLALGMLSVSLQVICMGAIAEDDQAGDKKTELAFSQEAIDFQLLKHIKFDKSDLVRTGSIDNDNLVTLGMKFFVEGTEISMNDFSNFVAENPKTEACQINIKDRSDSQSNSYILQSKGFRTYSVHSGAEAGNQRLPAILLDKNSDIYPLFSVSLEELTVGAKVKTQFICGRYSMGKNGLEISRYLSNNLGVVQKHLKGVLVPVNGIVRVPRIQIQDESKRVEQKDGAQGVS